MTRTVAADGSVLYMGGGEDNGGYRSITTGVYDFSAGGAIEFDFVLGNNNYELRYFEGADGGDEDVQFFSSINNGETWNPTRRSRMRRVCCAPGPIRRRGNSARRSS